MDKLDMHTKNLADEKFEALKKLFPNAITETIDENGEVVRAIDKDVLAQEISNEVVEGRDERYQFTWPDKRKAVLNANAPISKTLRPCREESVNFDETENLYIEGDNLDVLKLLQETYLGKIKMIYIDPPYNTGSDFVYNDSFKKSTEEYLEESGQVDEEGNRLEVNPESNGRFHTDWLNMIYPRLKLARNLLSDNGVIFISIDDNEQANLKKVCDEIFGEKNILGLISVVNNLKGRSDDEFFATSNEYLFCYAKNKQVAKILGLETDDNYKKEFKFEDSISKYKEVGLKKTGKESLREDRPDMFYPIYYNEKTKHISLTKYDNYIEILPIIKGKEGRWRWGKKTFLEKKETELVIKKNNKNIWNVYVKMRDIVDGEHRTVKPKTTWINPKFDSGSGTTQLENLLKLNDLFDNPKPIDYLKQIIQISDLKDSIMLDFFSGSATTAHAVMELNAEDGGNRKYIMVQLPEETDEKSEAYKAGYKNICEIGKERIRRAGKKILEDNKDKEGIEYLDIGFRVLKTDTSNMKDVYYKPADLKQNFLSELTDNIKSDRTPEDLLFQVMLDLGIPLSTSIDVIKIESKDVFVVDDGYLIACFDKDIDDALVTEIAKKGPAFAVFRDASMKSDSALNNFDQIFERISPETSTRVM